MFYSLFSQVQSLCSAQRHSTVWRRLLPLALTFVGVVQLGPAVASAPGLKDCSNSRTCGDVVQDPPNPPPQIDETTDQINYMNGTHDYENDGISNEVCPCSSLKTPPEYQLNEYGKRADLPMVSGYLSNWGIYSRQVEPTVFARFYDKIILSFFGLCGEPKNLFTMCGCRQNNLSTCNLAYQVASSDPWADFDKDLCNLPQGNHMEGSAYPSDILLTAGVPYYGMLGCAKTIHDDNPGIIIAMSIGGWTMSHRFSEMAENPTYREKFIGSVITVLEKYPFITQVDIDWEYPGSAGAGNTNSDADGTNFASLIRELKTALESANKGDVQLAMAASADVEKLKKSKIKEVIDAGIDVIHLMSYDFFGTPWAPSLAHHTNLYQADDTDTATYSADRAVNYLIDVAGAKPKQIHLGYAAYTRNGVGANITQYSPLAGTYKRENNPPAGGSWENGTHEYYDVLARFIDVTSPSAGLKVNTRHIKGGGYELYTDTVSNADFLYSKKTNYFISLDTPRTVYLKGQYVREKGLGGLFTWMADHDKGHLLNAAREGLGYTVNTRSRAIDMDKLIHTCGLDGERTIGPDECRKLTDIYKGGSDNNDGNDDGNGDANDDGNNDGNDGDNSDNSDNSGSESIDLLTWEATDEEGNLYQVEMRIREL